LENEKKYINNINGLNFIKALSTIEWEWERTC